MEGVEFTEKLTRTGFEAILKMGYCASRGLECYIWVGLSEQNIENFIDQGFRAPAVKILLNPYQGLKREKLPCRERYSSLKSC